MVNRTNGAKSARRWTPKGILGVAFDRKTEKVKVTLCEEASETYTTCRSKLIRSVGEAAGVKVTQSDQRSDKHPEL